MQHAPSVHLTEIIRLQRRDQQISTINKDCFVLSCRLIGESDFYCNDKVYTVHPGELLFIPLGASYRQSCAEETIVYCHFEAFSPLPQELQIWQATDTERVKALFSAAAEEWKNKRENYKCRCMAMFYEILSLAVVPDATEHPAGSGVAAPAIDYLRAHMYDTDFSVTAACRYAFISRACFNNSFHRRFGCSPSRYVQQSRMKKAAFLIKSGNYSNTEIAHLCGFADVKYFYTVFRRETGYTPSAYRAVSKP